MYLLFIIMRSTWNQSRKQSFAKITIKRLRTHDRKPLANEIHRDSILDSIKKKVILRNVCEKKFATNLSDNGGHKEEGRGGEFTPTGFRNGAAPSSSRTPSNHGFISRCTAPARPFPERINGLGCKLYRPRGEIPVREPFRSVYRWISNSVVRTPLTVENSLEI